MRMFLSFKISCIVNLWLDRYIESQVLYVWIGENLLSDLWICRSDRCCICWTARWTGWMGCQTVDVSDVWLPADCCLRKLFCAVNEMPRSENSRVVVIARNIYIYTILHGKLNVCRFDFCLTVHHWYKWYRQPTRCNNNGLLIIPVSSTCFGRWFCPSSGALDCVLQLVV